ncbi:TetR/AcrR family transcriptional regulator [Actinocorallia populi]|uniref:TetR/AcrR family transcriptional regulator n=1 Tax=Actinocorallia populi TaxID=2079200 RepID=UPI0018E58225|nr:TetR/AcrR family transcriptional regulator [Actinocorallia populi]
MASQTSRGPYAKSAAVRRRVLEACVEAFAQTGFHGATMKDIAKRAGISYTGLLHHFPRKEDLLIAVLEFRGEQSARLLEAVDALDPAEHPLEVLRGMLAVTADNERSPGLLELHCVMSGEAVSPEHPAHAYYTERYRNLRRFYTAAFTALAERGELCSPVAPAALATMTISLLNGLQAQWLYDRDTVDLAGCLRAFLVTFAPAVGD